MARWIELTGAGKSAIVVKCDAIVAFKEILGGSAEGLNCEIVTAAEAFQVQEDISAVLAMAKVTVKHD